MFTSGLSGFAEPLREVLHSLQLPFPHLHFLQALARGSSDAQHQALWTSLLLGIVFPVIFSSPVATGLYCSYALCTSIINLTFQSTSQIHFICCLTGCLFVSHLRMMCVMAVLDAGLYWLHPVSTRGCYYVPRITNQCST